MDDIRVIPNFNNYEINLQKMKITNRKTKKTLKPRKISKNRIFYRLYDNGVSQQLSLFQILRLIFNSI